MTDRVNKKHILYVDDDEQSRRLFGSKIADAGYEVLYAKDGNEGREVARRLQPDLIVMDLNMPIMNGIEAASRLKSEEVTKNIPIIFLANQDISIETQKAFVELGVLGYMQKGIDHGEFIERIHKAFKNQSAS
ncbi:MAG: response regulator [Patescibacteria group bacterium]